MFSKYLAEGYLHIFGGIQIMCDSGEENKPGVLWLNGVHSRHEARITVELIEMGPLTLIFLYPFLNAIVNFVLQMQIMLFNDQGVDAFNLDKKVEFLWNL